MKEEILKPWQGRRDTEKYGRITNSFILKVDNLPQEVVTFEMAQILTRHGEFGRHLKRLGKVDDGLCPTCGLLNEPGHRIMECNLYKDEQAAVKAYHGQDYPTGLDELYMKTPSDLLYPFLACKMDFVITLDPEPPPESEPHFDSES